MCYDFSDTNPETIFNLRSMGNFKNITNTIWRFLNNYCLLIILPLSFVLLGLNKYPYLISSSAIPGVFANSLVTVFLFYMIPRFKYNHFKSSIIAVWLGSLFLFYRDLIKGLVMIPGLAFINYSPVNVGLSVLLTAIVVYFTIRASDKNTNQLYRGVQIFIFGGLFINMVMLLKNYCFTSPNLIQTGVLKTNGVNMINKPDVYCIMVDEYSGFNSLNFYHHYKNQSFKDELQKLNFQIAENPSSNYNLTLISCLSLLDMNYIQNQSKFEYSSRSIFLKSYKKMFKNNVFGFFQACGYKTFNNSFFHIMSDYSNSQSVINLDREALQEKTFSTYATKTFLNHIPSNTIQLNLQTKLAREFKYNESVIRYFNLITEMKEVSPKFVYTHLMMPHFPYLRSKRGVKNFSATYKEGTDKQTRNYIEYLEYTNSVVLNFVCQILKSNKNAIIIITSDHGDRFSENRVREKFDFNNFFAIYKPDQNYTGFTDTICTVNIFRSLLNNQYNQTIPLLDNKKQDVAKNHL
jgi:hypothetical protein